MQATKKNMLNLDEVAEILCVSRRTVERSIADGRLKKTKIRNCARIMRQELDRYINNSTGRDQ